MQVGQCWACILTGVTQGFNGHVSPEDDGILAACPSDPHCRSRRPAATLRCVKTAQTNTAVRSEPVEDIVHNLQIRDIVGLVTQSHCESHLSACVSFIGQEIQGFKRLNMIKLLMRSLQFITVELPSVRV